jgi:hypothetical protein
MTACQLPFWVQLLQALSVPTLAAFGIYIALRQWLTARERLKLDLFDRRLAAYGRLRDATAPVNASGKVRNEDIDAFGRARQDMQFLFDKELEQGVSEIHKAMGDKHVVDIQIDQAQGDARQLHQKSMDLFSKITSGVYSDIPARMERFLRFRRNS